MKKNRFFSGALFRENIRRFWPISAVGFFIYFISGPLILLSQKNQDAGLFFGGSLSEYMVKNMNFGFEAMHVALPLVAALCVFSYLNKVNSVGAVHSMPFSRRTLYVTNYISGLFLCVVPLIATFILMLPGKVAVGAAAEWLFASFCIVLFIYSIAVLGCMVSGNNVIALLTGFALNFLVPVLVLCMYGYASRFFYGFYSRGDIMSSITVFNPALRTISGGGLSIRECLIYLAVAVVIAVLADVLYHVRKLERCGDSYVFVWMQWIVSFLFVFVITTITGLLLFEGLGLTAYIIGFVIGFVLGQMISLKTLHIFTKKTLVMLLIFAVIMALIVACFSQDIFGFEKRVPEAESVSSVSVTQYSLRSSGYGPVEFSKQEEIAAAVSLHEKLIKWYEEEYKDKNTGEMPDFSVTPLTVSYRLKNGRSMSREYMMPVDMISSDELKTLRSSSAMLDPIRRLPQLRYNDVYITVTDLFSSQPGQSGTWELSKEQTDSLLSALAADLEKKASSPIYADGTGSKFEIILEVGSVIDDMQKARDYYKDFACFDYVDMSMLGSQTGEQHLFAEFSFTADENCTNTLKWLKDNGFAGF